MSAPFALAGPSWVAPGRPLLLPDGRTVVVPAWVESAEMASARRRIVRSRFFLVSLRGGQMGERLRCGRCGGKHDYLTRYCLELPFSGLMGSLWAYVATTSGVDLDTLDPAAAARLVGLRMLMGGDRPRDLATSHPATARALRRSMADPTLPADRYDIDVGAVAVGVIDPLEVGDAQRLLDAINTRARLYRYPIVKVEGLATR